MSFFGNLFGKPSKSQEETLLHTPVPAKLLAAQTVSADPANDPNMVRVFDAYEREMFIAKEEWRKNVLPESIKSNWNNPEGLYAIIFGALNDGFRSDVMAAANQLYRIDPQPARGTCVWGIVLMEEGRFDEAEKTFRDHISKHGEDGSVLTNLAKVYSRRKNTEKAEEILWHGLEVDPNQDNGMGWYYAIHRERGGEASGQEALKRIAALPNSWRAQLWLARTALQGKNLEQALAYYREGLSRAGKEVPTDLLTQMSGDLGNHGHLPELLELTEPPFVVQTHGLPVGNNLIKAHLRLGQFELAHQILNQLYALKRPDWNQTLRFWDTEIAKARLGSAPVGVERKLRMAMLTIEGPIWIKPSSPASELFPAKSTGGLTICFLGSSAEVASNSKRIQHQLADSPGRMSRALPLYLAEQVDFRSNARVRTLIPWIAEESAGFVVCGVAWDDQAAANYARQGQHKSDYVVIVHLKAQAEPWSAELRLVRTIDGKSLGNLTAAFPTARPETSIPDLANRLLGLLAEQAGVEYQAPPPTYRVPDDQNFPYYLLRLEQLLAVRCAAMDGIRANFLSGEREIINGNLQLCLAWPQNIGARLLLIQTVSTMKKVRPDILVEFKEKLNLLQKEKPLPEPSHSLVQRILNDLF